MSLSCKYNPVQATQGKSRNEEPFRHRKEKQDGW